MPLTSQNKFSILLGVLSLFTIVQGENVFVQTPYDFYVMNANVGSHQCSNGVSIGNGSNPVTCVNSVLSNITQCGNGTSCNEYFVYSKNYCTALGTGSSCIPGPDQDVDGHLAQLHSIYHVNSITPDQVAANPQLQCITCEYGALFGWSAGYSYSYASSLEACNYMFGQVSSTGSGDSIFAFPNYALGNAVAAALEVTCSYAPDPYGNICNRDPDGGNHGWLVVNCTENGTNPVPTTVYGESIPAQVLGNMTFYRPDCSQYGDGYIYMPPNDYYAYGGPVYASAQCAWNPCIWEAATYGVSIPCGYSTCVNNPTPGGYPMYTCV